MQQQSQDMRRAAVMTRLKEKVAVWSSAATEAEAAIAAQTLPVPPQNERAAPPRRLHGHGLVRGQGPPHCEVD